MKKILICALLFLSYQAQSKSYFCHTPKDFEGSFILISIGEPVQSSDADGNKYEARTMEIIENFGDKVTVEAAGIADKKSLDLTLLSEGDIISGSLKASRYAKRKLKGIAKIQNVFNNQEFEVDCEISKEDIKPQQ